MKNRAANVPWGLSARSMIMILIKLRRAPLLSGLDSIKSSLRI